MFALSEVTEGLNAMALPFLGVHINLGQVQLLMPCTVRGNWSIHCAREWDLASQSIHMQKPAHPYFFSTLVRTTPTNASISQIDWEIQAGLYMAKKRTLQSDF